MKYRNGNEWQKHFNIMRTWQMVTSKQLSLDEAMYKRRGRGEFLAACYVIRLSDGLITAGPYNNWDQARDEANRMVEYEEIEEIILNAEE